MLCSCIDKEQALADFQQASAARLLARKEKRRANAREWYRKNPEKSRAYWDTERGRAVRDRYYNSDAGKTSRLRSYLKNREKIDARNALTRQTPEYKSKQRAYLDTYYQNPLKRVHKLILGVRTRARNDGYEFDPALFEYMESNIPTHCPCCGVVIEYMVTKRALNNPSIDRVDNSKGYTIANSRITCWRCNMNKSDCSIKDFENMIAYMKANWPA